MIERQFPAHAARFACKRDSPEALADCLRLLNADEKDPVESELFLSAAARGSEQVLGWFLENRASVVRDSIRRVPGFDHATVRWLVDSFGPGRSTHPDIRPDWVRVRADASFTETPETRGLLQWIAVPPCTRAGSGGCEVAFGDEPDMHYACSACRIQCAEKGRGMVSGTSGQDGPDRETGYTTILENGTGPFSL